MSVGMVHTSYRPSLRTPTLDHTLNTHHNGAAKIRQSLQTVANWVHQALEVADACLAAADSTLLFSADGDDNRKSKVGVKSTLANDDSVLLATRPAFRGHRLSTQ